MILLFVLLYPFAGLIPGGKLNMKKNRLLIGLLAAGALCQVTGCSLEKTAANDWEGLYEMYQNFFKKTYEQTNMTIDFYHDGVKKEWTEQIRDNTCHIISENGDIWAWLNEVDTKIVGYQLSFEGSDSHYYIANDKLYEETYKAYIGRLSILDDANEKMEEGLDYEDREKFANSTFSAEKKDLGNDLTSFTCTIDTKAFGTFKGSSFVFHAEAKEGLVTKVSFTGVDLGDEDTMSRHVFKITYNNVSKIKIPDITGWEAGNYESK